MPAVSREEVNRLPADLTAGNSTASPRQRHKWRFFQFFNAILASNPRNGAEKDVNHSNAHLIFRILRRIFYQKNHHIFEIHLVLGSHLAYVTLIDIV
ncbi:hypothetical protein [Roseibium marinum]|uniref:hypothetical protein n=1 Tax=Roseibium marinum TaxID=281252 RepID=UPI000CD2BF20|nr:hypothetical protein [Roseibium marinum]